MYFAHYVWGQLKITSINVLTFLKEGLAWPIDKPFRVISKLMLFIHHVTHSWYNPLMELEVTINLLVVVRFGSCTESQPPGITL